MFTLDKNPEKDLVEFTFGANGQVHTVSVSASRYLLAILDVSSKLLAIETAEHPDEDDLSQVDRCLRKSKLLVLNSIMLTAEDVLNPIQVIQPEESPSEQPVPQPKEPESGYRQD